MKELLNTIETIIVSRFKQRTTILEEPKAPGYPTTPIIKVGKALLYKFEADELDIFPYFNKAVPFLNLTILNRCLKAISCRADT